MTTEIATVVDDFVALFNHNDLDRVMEFFADDAEYRPGDGKEHHGKAAIRRAFEPQFTGAFGDMVFIVDDKLVDETARKASIRWVCRHDVSGEKGRRMPFLLRLWFRMKFGTRAGWYGVDVFHFDEQRKIKAKYSYANFDRPQLRRELGNT